MQNIKLPEIIQKNVCKLIDIFQIGLPYYMYKDM